MNHARMHVSRFEHYDHQSPTERPSIIIHERNSENGRNRHNKTPAHHLPKSADRDSFEMPPFFSQRQALSMLLQQKPDSCQSLRHVGTNRGVVPPLFDLFRLIGLQFLCFLHGSLVRIVP